ncbi:DUF3987 domain-containing protein [Arcicella sp. LKC2W]|uniref:DUF3987 domain-containing protein n=1 Tax=Arcicella sp. LKC2W TaxID=2984198 RepID=UPI002B1FFDEE|nr:DUF3987 domain-containing protein [Arcicella sp. LKC2W]MEA5459859.1 DUF3987 domain-containing protein [Arcicella sp. LKC2W]
MTQNDNVPVGEVCLSDLENELNHIENGGEINGSEKTISEPKFPLEVFPEIIQKIILSAQTTLNYPVEFTASSVLLATSIAVGNTHRVKIKTGFEQSAIIYLCLVAPTGSVKSHPLEFALKPIQNADIASYNAYKIELIEYLKAKEDGKDNTENQQKPFWKKFLISDYTAEALYTIHSKNQRSIGVYIDEIAGWFKNFERYNKNSQQEFWLSAWSNKTVTVDRKMSEPCLITRPFISVGGTIQPLLLKEITKENRGKNGFIDRLLFVYLKNLIKQGWNDEEMSEDLISSYNSIINCLLDLPCQYDKDGQIEATILQFTAKGRENLYTWVNQINTPLTNQTDNEEFKGIYTKLEQYVPRFALLLHLLKWASEETDEFPPLSISAETVDGAIKLGEYFRNSAIAVNKVLNNQLDDLPINHKEWYSKLPEKLTTEIALNLGDKFQLSERTIMRFLSNKDIFRKLKHGHYEKIF